MEYSLYSIFSVYNGIPGFIVSAYADKNAYLQLLPMTFHLSPVLPLHLFHDCHYVYIDQASNSSKARLLYIYDVTFQFQPVLMVVKDNTHFYQNQWEKHRQYDYPEGYSQQLQLVRPLTQS